MSSDLSLRTVPVARRSNRGCRGPLPADGAGGAQCVLACWRARDGLPLFGYPLTGELAEAGRTVQYFAQARFELHPESAIEHRVQLGRVGAELLEARRGAGGHRGG